MPGTISAAYAIPGMIGHKSDDNIESGLATREGIVDGADLVLGSVGPSSGKVLPGGAALVAWPASSGGNSPLPSGVAAGADSGGISRSPGSSSGVLKPNIRRN